MESLPVVIGVVVLLFILLAAGLPVFAALGTCGALGLFLLQGTVGLTSIGRSPFFSLYSFTLLALPLFVFMGELLNRSGIAAKIYVLATNWVGHLPGGLAMGSVLACAIFAAMCGSAVAGAATIGLIAIPEMTKRGYNKSLSTGTLAAAGPLAVLIPPSIIMILYGTIAEVSVGSLFMAGFIPGAILATLMMTYLAIHCSLKPNLAPKSPPAPWSARLSSLKALWAPVFLVIMVMGSIYAGIATPTEAAGMGVLGSLILSGLVYKTLNWQNFQEATLGTIKTTTFVFMIVACAIIFAHFVTHAGLTLLIRDYVIGLGPSPYLVLIMLNALCIILGCFIDPLGIMYITLPLLLPTFSALGIDLIWLGVIITINMEIAQITPPVGFTLFVISGITDVPIGTIIRGVIPFIFIEMLMIAIVILLPQIALWLPSTMF
ncbi:TRAP transporter large permease [Chloroflexota bacterium]